MMGVVASAVVPGRVVVFERILVVVFMVHVQLAHGGQWQWQ